MARRFSLGISSLFLLAGPLAAQESIDALVERGSELFHSDIGCWVCHAETGEGLVGPESCTSVPTPVDIFDQLESNPVMGVIVSRDGSRAMKIWWRSRCTFRTLADLPLDAEYARPVARVRLRR